MALRCALLMTFSMALASMCFAEEYRYFKEPVQIRLDPTVVAIKGHSPMDLLQAADLRAGEARRLAMMDWWLFSFPSASGASRSPGSLHSHEAIDRLKKADVANQFWVSPVYHRNDGIVVPTPTILLKLAAGATIATLGVEFESSANWRTATPFGPGGSMLKLSGDWADGREVLEEANRLAGHPAVVFAEPDMLITGGSAGSPSDPLFPDSWGLQNTGQFGGTPGFDVQALDAWQQTTGKPSISVVILDTGVDQSHPDINQVPGTDFTDQPGVNGGPGNPCDNHGTPVAGVVSGRLDNGIGTAGIAPNAVIVSARVFVSDTEFCDGRWLTQYSWTADALTWAESIGVRVSNNSNYYLEPSGAITTAYQQTRDNGMIHFGISGNDGFVVSYPGTLAAVNAVGAIESSGSLWPLSNTGPEVFLVGPGVDIYTTDRQGANGWDTGDYTLAFGTSFASPFAAGMAALILSLDPSLSPDEIESYLGTGSRDLGPPGFDSSYGNGLMQGRDSIDLFFVFGDGFEMGDTSAWS